MGSVTGTLFGPVLGGLLADAFGFQYTFIITSVSVAIAAIIVLIGIKEQKRVKNRKSDSLFTNCHFKWYATPSAYVKCYDCYSTYSNWKLQHPAAAIIICCRTDRCQRCRLLAGITFSAAGVGNLLFARKWGKLGDDIGYEKVLSILLLLSFVFIIPQAFVTELWQLMICRLLFGIAVGGMIPITTALVRREAPVDIQGEVMGYNTSFRFLGNIIGPMFGGILSGFIGISSVFIVTGTLFLVGFAFLYYAKRKPVQDFEDFLAAKDHQSHS